MAAAVVLVLVLVMVMVLVSVVVVVVVVVVLLGHALHEKGLQRQNGDGTLVRSRERRAAVVPRMNQISTGCQPRVNRTFCSACGFHGISFVRASEKSLRTVVHDAPEGTRVSCLLGEPTRRRPVLSRTDLPLSRAPPRRDPPVVCLRFSRTCLAWKGFTDTHRRRHTGQQPGTKRARGPADKPVINSGSTAGFVPPPVYIKIPLFVLAQGCAEAHQACRGDGVLVCI